MEAAGLGLFMVSAAVVTTLLEYPASPVHVWVPDPLCRRMLIGLAMGLTAITLIYSPWGQRSGAHLNPAVTLTFYRLGKVRGADAVGYIVAQCGGGAIGLAAAAWALGNPLADPPVNFVVTVPGTEGTAVAFLAEAAMSCGMMSLVLVVSNQGSLRRWTGVCAGVLVAWFIAVEAPLSGMSMNPARSLASALPAHLWTSFWIYLAAPPLGMLLAAEWYVRRVGLHRVLCAKLHHPHDQPCLFRCGDGAGQAAPSQREA